MAYPQPTQGYQPGPPAYTPYSGQPQPGYAPQPPQQYGYQPQPAGYGQQQQSNTNVVVVQQQAAPRVSESLILYQSVSVFILKRQSKVYHSCLLLRCLDQVTKCP